MNTVSKAQLPHRHKLLFLILGSVSLLVVGAAAGFIVLLSGAYSTAATKQHFAVTHRILEAGLRYSVASYARDIATPDLSRLDVELGQACYRSYCEQCHGAPGIARAAIGQGQLPSPSSLVQSAREWPAAHLFYVVQKGVRMSGMPAWEFRISEQGLWATVAFLKHMPWMRQADYERMSRAQPQPACPPASEPLAYSVERARTILQQYSCPDCHRIAGIVGPRTHIGPALEDWRAQAHRRHRAEHTRAAGALDPRAGSAQSEYVDAGPARQRSTCAHHGALFVRAAVSSGANLSATLLSGVLALTGCGADADYQPRVRGGNAQRGAHALREHECGVCHVIPGIAGAHGRVGPSLAEYSRFPYLAGKFPNRPELLVRWIADAPALAPQTAMPAIAMREQEARDIAAYLYQLE